MDQTPTVYVVDDDAAVLDSLRWLIESSGLVVRTFSSAMDFLDVVESGSPGCLVLDVRMPDMGGLELLEGMRDRGLMLPVIMVTGHGDVPLAVRAIKAGAMEFLEKPFSEESLLQHVRRALEKDRKNRLRRDRVQCIHDRMQTLTPRERQVLERIIAGRLNKQIALDLGLSHKTVEIHRGRLMRKMQANTVADLVRLTLAAELETIILDQAG